MWLVTAEDVGKTEQGAAPDWTKRVEQHPAGHAHYREGEEEEEEESQETIRGDHDLAEVSELFIYQKTEIT